MSSDVFFKKHDEELVFIYSMRTVGIIQIIFSIICIVCALVNITSSVNVIEDNFLNRTFYIVENYQIYPNGTRFVMLPDETTGEKVQLLLEEWVEHFKIGQYMYAFGGNFNNYCWPRELSDDEWFKSLWRSSQLKAMVQVPLRLLVLAFISIKAFEVFIISSRKCIFGDKYASYIFTGFIINEFLHNLVKFETVNFLVSPDEKYSYVLIPTIQLLHVTLVLKMVFSCFYAKSGEFIVLRIFLAILAIQCYNGNINSASEFLEYPYCDEFSELSYVISEYGMLLILFFASIIDVCDCKEYELILRFNPLIITPSSTNGDKIEYF